MKANELRIGNLFQDREGRICSVELITGEIDKCDILAIDGAITALPIEPIPLTEEWLLKFGFEKWNDYCYCNNKLAIEGITSSFDKSICLFRCGNDDYVELTNIKYVHSLQNIHFYITGEELTLQES